MVAVAHPTLEAAVAAAVATVDDPEYPGLAITELGLLERIVVDRGRARIELVPTYGGCPALGYIEADVRTAVGAVAGVAEVEVVWLRRPVWTPDRLSAAAVEFLGREFTVAIRRRSGEIVCPVCGAAVSADPLASGPVRCRTVASCATCRNPIEVVR